jgi:hypothetical protein
MRGRSQGRKPGFYLYEDTDESFATEAESSHMTGPSHWAPAESTPPGSEGQDYVEEYGQLTGASTPDTEGILRVYLRHMATGEDALRRDFARDVLAGHLTLQQAAMSAAYREIFESGMKQIVQAAADLTSEELDEAAAEEAREIERHLEQEERRPWPM